MILGIIDKLNEFMEPIEEWIFEHNDSPIFWFVLFVAIICIFLIASAALEKGK